MLTTGATFTDDALAMILDIVATTVQKTTRALEGVATHGLPYSTVLA